MAKTRTAQQNAISYSITERENKKAREFLSRIDINYEIFCKAYGWKASASRLETKVWDLLCKLYREMDISICKVSEKDRVRVLQDFENETIMYCYSYKEKTPYFYYIDDTYVFAVDFKGNLYRNWEVEEYL